LIGDIRLSLRVHFAKEKKKLGERGKSVSLR
jgi:hypothetical protein